jgi:hypothetical protein
MAATRLFVDADACPVRTEAERVAVRLGVPLLMVSNGGIRPSAHPLVESVFVPEGADQADRWIAERAGPGDVVVTADTVLAVRCIAAGARVVTPDGAVLSAANIGPKLAARDLAADLRAADPFRPGGGRPFARADRSRFLDTLDRMLRAAQAG